MTEQNGHRKGSNKVATAIRQSGFEKIHMPTQRNAGRDGIRQYRIINHTSFERPTSQRGETNKRPLHSGLKECPQQILKNLLSLQSNLKG
jgi:hypothetical protein